MPEVCEHLPLTFGSLFSGIGGFDLGFERAGMQCKWQVEIDPYCQKVLAKHWPNVRRHDDIRSFPPPDADEWRVDVICGGFPCQDISNAGKRIGISGGRSGLFFELMRVVRTLRPRIVVLENVAALLANGMDQVLGELAESGFDAEWEVLPACAFGAPHIRKRIFILAYAEGECRELRQTARKRPRRLAGVFDSVSDTNSERLEKRQGIGCDDGEKQQAIKRSDWWSVEPSVGRVADGVSARVDRLRALGNAVVPQVAEWVGRRIVEANK